MIQTCEEVVYEKLQGMILRGELPVDEFLPQRKLAEQVDATIVTLRSALRRLENDGLIVNVPKWGVRIPAETEKDLADRYYARELIETGAVAKWLPCPPPNAKSELLALAARCDAIRPEKPESYQEFCTQHAAFHLRLVELADNSILIQVLMRLNFRNMMLGNAHNCWMMAQEYLVASHHVTFVEKLFSLPADEVPELIREHVRRGYRLELARFQKLNKR